MGRNRIGKTGFKSSAESFFKHLGGIQMLAQLDKSPRQISTPSPSRALVSSPGRTSALTWLPCFMSSRVRTEPMNPVAPVINAFITTPHAFLINSYN